MEIVRSQRRSVADGSGGAISLPLYKSAPSLEVRLEEFERCAIDRLRVLKAISDGLSRGKKPEEMDNLVSELWRSNMRHQDADETLRRDIISHFALRLVYCREEEMRRWFLSMETALFRYRFRLQNAEAQKLIMNELQLQYNVLSHAEYETIKDKLIQAARSVNSTSNPETVFYKVPFEDVPDLVATRRVFLLQGFAFVPRNQVVSLVCTMFRSNISKALALTNRKWRATIQDQEKDRLAPIVEALGNSYLGPDYSQPRECAEISLKDINHLASTSFPLCMRHLFGKLKEDHHLKHGGRMQLGLFLKGVGLKLEDALAFWRAEFSKKVGAERFDKEYAYSIRHNYGKEGKRTDYTPYSCQKIIMSTPSTGDHHGCPFRHFSEENLRAALNKMGVAGRAIDDIMDKVRNRHYQQHMRPPVKLVSTIQTNTLLRAEKFSIARTNKVSQLQKCLLERWSKHAYQVLYINKTKYGSSSNALMQLLDLIVACHIARVHSKGDIAENLLGKGSETWHHLKASGQGLWTSLCNNTGDSLIMS